MIDDAVEKGTAVEVQARQYEGLTVWINSLIAGAGGQIVDQDGDVKVDDTRQDGRRDREQARQVAGGAAGHVHQRGGPGAPGLRVGALRLPGQLPVRLPERGGGRRGLPEEHRLGALPAHATRTRRAGRRSAASTSASRSIAETPDLAFEAAECLANEQHQAVAAELGGLPPTTESVYETEQVKKAYPFADLLRESIEAAAPRPGDPGLQRHLAGDPEDLPPADGVDPNGIVEKLRDRIEKAAEGKIF